MAIDRFMIVDEVEANILFFTVVLTELGFKNIATATNGEDALLQAAKQTIHFIIAAWEMPTMPGTVLLQRLRVGKRRRMAYTIYSKRMTPEDLTLTRELGLPNVMSLPLDRDKAKAAIKAQIDAENALTPEAIKLRKIEGYVLDNRPNEALQLFDASLKKKGPHAAHAQTLLGQIWLMVGQNAHAEAALNAALAENPGGSEPSNLLATLYSKTGRHEQAIALLGKMAEASPKNITTLLNLGSAYVEAERLNEAKKTFDLVSAIDPDSPPLKDERGKLAFKEGDLPLAAKLLAETQNGDGLSRHFNNLAIALTHQGKFTQAIETYENAIKLLTSKAKLHALHYNLGLALAKKGELGRSFVELAQSYKDDPSFEKAYAAFARIGKQMEESGLSYDKNLVREVNQVRKQHKATAAAPAPSPAKTVA